MTARYTDTANFPEDDRITLIGDAVMAGEVGKEFVFITDYEPGKPERYIEKLTTRYPKIFVINRFDNVPIQGATSVKVGRRP